MRNTSPERPIIASWDSFIATGQVPDFEGRGRYPRYSSRWDRIGLADAPQYPGQQPLRYPPEWPPAYCFLAAASLKALSRLKGEDHA